MIKSQKPVHTQLKRGQVIFMNKKLLLKSACIAFVLTVIYSVIPFQAQCSTIPDDVFRLHILANSDSGQDQSLKLKVRDRVLEYTKNLFESASGKEEAENLIADNLSAITDVAQSAVKDNGYDYKVESRIVNMYFSTRHYQSYTLPSGMYDALRITIGSGKGHNWWCVMYPSICISSEKDGEEKAKQTFSEGEYDVVRNEKYEYRFFVVEMFESMCNYFRNADS